MNCVAYKLKIEKEVEKTLIKIAKRNMTEYVTIYKKVKQIVKQPNRYKPLGNVLKGERRVQIGPKVLVFDTLEEEKLIRILRYEHHDTVYKHKLS